ncbi:MAG: helix-turn-helix transcriptional regulator [Bacteroidota bacterium]
MLIQAKDPDTMRIAEQIGLRIRSLRLEKGWSQEELAFRSQMHRAYIGHIERGERNISIATLEKVAGALGVKVRVFFP